MIFTAPMSTRDPDRFDVTRGNAQKAADKGRLFPGEPFAPSWKILNPALEQRAEFKRSCEANGRDPAEVWFTLYSELYAAEMRASYRRNRAAWDDLIARPRTVLVCFCRDARACHRTLLARILVKCGAEFGGELAA